jgi:hypothetical protein
MSRKFFAVALMGLFTLAFAGLGSCQAGSPCQSQCQGGKGSYQGQCGKGCCQGQGQCGKGWRRGPCGGVLIGRPGRPRVTPGPTTIYGPGGSIRIIDRW